MEPTEATGSCNCWQLRDLYGLHLVLVLALRTLGNRFDVQGSGVRAADSGPYTNPHAVELAIVEQIFAAPQAAVHDGLDTGAEAVAADLSRLVRRPVSVVTKGRRTGPVSTMRLRNCYRSSLRRIRRISVLDPRVRAGKHNGLVTVGVADEVRRRTVDASRLQDHSSMVPHPHGLALEMKTITLRGSHGALPVDGNPLNSLNRDVRALNSALPAPPAKPNVQPLVVRRRCPLTTTWTQSRSRSSIERRWPARRKRTEDSIGPCAEDRMSCVSGGRRQTGTAAWRLCRRGGTKTRLVEDDQTGTRATRPTCRRTDGLRAAGAR